MVVAIFKDYIDVKLGNVWKISTLTSKFSKTLFRLICPNILLQNTFQSEKIANVQTVKYGAFIYVMLVTFTAESYLSHWEAVYLRV